MSVQGPDGGLGAVDRAGAAVAGVGTKAKVFLAGNGFAAIAMNASRGKKKRRKYGRQQCQKLPTRLVGISILLAIDDPSLCAKISKKSR